jgi:ABC-2 type transport system permease protein
MGLVRAETIKVLATRRTLIGFVLALLALVAIGTAAVVQPVTNDAVVDYRGTLRDVLSDAAGSAVFVSLILGALISTWEYQHRIMTQTLLAAPQRERVVGAKATVSLCFGLAFGAVAVVLALAIAVLWLGSGGSDELSTGDLWLHSGRVVLAAGLWAALGSGLGALLSSQVGTIIAMLLWLFVAEPLTGGFLEGVHGYLPGRAMESLLGVSDGGFAPAAGLGLTLAYVAVFTGAGVLATSRRDIV